jgi:sulfatase-like protein
MGLRFERIPGLGPIDESHPACRYNRAMIPQTQSRLNLARRNRPTVRLAWALLLGLSACQKSNSPDPSTASNSAIVGAGHSTPGSNGDESDWVGLYGRRAQGREIPLDFIFVSIDTLRADHLPFYGYPRATAGDSSQPFSLAWLAEKSLVYQTCWAPIGKTLPSLGSFWTGEFPLTHGGISNPTVVQSPTFAQRFQADRFQTFAAVANRALGPFVGLARGFDGYEIRAKQQESDIPSHLLEVSAPVIQAQKPLMLWAHFMTPHQPYEPPEPYARTYTEQTEPPVDNDLLYEFHIDPKTLTPELKQYCIDLYDAEILTANSRLQELLLGLDRSYKNAGRGG